MREIEQPFGRFQGRQQCRELAFDLFLADGFPVIGASFGIAQIVRIELAAPLRPISGHGIAAAAAGDEAAQREVLADILLRRSLGHAITAILRRLPCGKRHQPLMLALRQTHAPILAIDVSGIDRTREQFLDALVMDFPAPILRPDGLGFEEGFHFRERLEAARGIALEYLGENGSERLVTHQQLAMAGTALEAIAQGTAERPIAVLQPRLHPVLGLLGVLLALVLRDGRQQVFHEDGIGIVAELDRRAFQLAARLAQQIAQIPMPANIAAEPADVVDDDDQPILAAGFEEFDHRHHGGAHGMAAAHIVAEHIQDLITLHRRIVAAAPLLTGKAIALHPLLDGRDAAIQHRLLFLLQLHHCHADESSFPRLSAALGRKALVSLCCLLWVSDDPITLEAADSSSIDKESTCRARSTCCTGSSPKARSTKLCMICQTAKSSSALRSSGISKCATWWRYFSASKTTSEATGGTGGAEEWIGIEFPPVLPVCTVLPPSFRLLRLFLSTICLSYSGLALMRTIQEHTPILQE
ncbi:hypothetical protein EV665_10421 [Shinella granuli]|uniref:Uncharacterized protein n=1 Tax=Shinella granuli TaxID=323621 RepID=A0A4V2RJ05_SHIGR|nr:hypothetical protein EV665_10421 [Shinella granuli]